jgi:hypothetical protein
MISSRNDRDTSGYFGDDAADFYSAQGWGTTATMGAVWSLWTLAVSISILRSAKHVAVPARHTERTPAYA